MKGKWTEIFTRRPRDIPNDMETSDGNLHGQGWACTCGCGKRVHGRKHNEGVPRDECDTGFIPTSGGASEAYRNNYDVIKWDRKITCETERLFGTHLAEAYRALKPLFTKSNRL